MAEEQGNWRIGVVGVPEGWSTRQLVEAARARTRDAVLLPADRLTLDLERGRAYCAGHDLHALDAVIVKKVGAHYAPELLERLEVLRYLDESGVPVFSHPLAMMRAIDRMSGTVTLRLADVPMPPTVITEDVAEAADAVQRFGRAVLKPLYTSKARGMQVIEAGPDAATRLADFRAAGHPMLYVQKMVELPGYDYGIVFLGGEYLASYSRVSEGVAWHTSTSGGGKYRLYEPTPDIMAVAERAQAAFGLTFTSVDVAETPDGPIVFEVSAFGGFRGLRESQGLDAAERYVDYVVRKLAHAREARVTC